MCGESTKTHHRGSFVFSAGSAAAVFGWLCLFCLAQPARAEITASGDVQPAHPATWTSRTTAYVGMTLSGTLGIANGSAVTSFYGYIGHDSGSTGEVTVDGSGSTWATESLLYVGYKGSGTLSIAGGGAVSSSEDYIGYAPGSTGVVTVDGVDSTWTESSNLHVGQEGCGTLSIRGGAAVSSGSSGYVGRKPGSTGEVTVAGAGSTLASGGWLIVGSEGSGTLTITGAGAVSNTTGSVGSSSGSTGEVTVDGAGSTWTNSGDLYVGDRGRGTLSIAGGGAVSNSFGYIGYFLGSTGAVTVAGAGSTWTNTDNLLVGSLGDWTLDITDGGLVSVSGTLDLDEGVYGDGFDNMAGGGMLALHGQAETSLNDFLGLIEGTDAIRYWDAGTSDWADITGATYGTDYTLTYMTESELSGYTVLTVFPVPEPATLGLLAAGAIALGRRRRAI